MVTPNDFFTEEEKKHLAQIATTFSVVVGDQESFDDFLFTLRAALSHEEATKLLAMAAAVISHASDQAIDKVAMLLANRKATEN